MLYLSLTLASRLR